MMSGLAPSEEGEPVAPVPESAPRHESAARARWLPVWAVLAGLVAACAAWGLGETPLAWVKPKQSMFVTMGQRMMGTSVESEHAAAAATAARLYGALGAALGLALGVAGALGSRAPRRALKAAPLGLILGALAGATASIVSVPLFYRFEPMAASDLAASMAMHGAIWGAAGAAGGLALAVGAGARPLRLLGCAVGGLLGGMIGAALFDVVGALVFASDLTGEPYSTAAVARLCAALIVAVCVAIGAIAGVGERRARADRR